MHLFTRLLIVVISIFFCFPVIIFSLGLIFGTLSNPFEHHWPQNLNAICNLLAWLFLISMFYAFVCLKKLPSYMVWIGFIAGLVTLILSIIASGIAGLIFAIPSSIVATGFMFYHLSSGEERDC